LFRRIFLTLNEFRPYPKAFGASVDCRADFKSGILVEQYSVKNVALSGSVFSHYSDDTDVFLLVDLLAEPLDGFLVDG